MYEKLNTLLTLIEARQAELSAKEAGYETLFCRHKSTGQPLVKDGLLKWVKKKDSYDQVYALTDKGRELCDRLLETTETFLEGAK